MNITRRAWMGVTAAAVAAPAFASAQTAPRFAITSPGKGVHDYGPALAALAEYARAELAAQGLPGMTLSVTDADGFTAVLALGWADMARREPMSPDRLFQIGSISKSFLALTLLSLADEGRIDLDAPLARYLPEAAWPSAPITGRQVLSHTSGLPDGAPLFPRTPEGRLWTGFSAGSRFSYSNTGFDLLGAVVERITGLSHEEAILRRVRVPLGVADIAGQISAANRARFPVAYLPHDQSVAAELPGAAMDEAPWDPEDTAAGCIGATSEMMARYLRGLLAIGAGKGAPVLSDTSAKAFATPVIASDADFGPGSHYCLGVALQPVDGAPCLHHTGGMVAFSSSFHADPAAGVACFASVNARLGGYRPRQTTAYAIRLMRAVRAGAPLPSPPDPLGPLRVKEPGPLMGHFIAADGRSFTLAPGEDFPHLAAAGAAAPAYRQGGRLATSHPAFAAHLLEPVSEGAAVTGYWWGETLFGRDAPAAQPAVPERLRAFTGVYLNRSPWVGYGTVLARGDDLVLEGAGRLIERGGWWSLEPDVGGVERFRFEAPLNGKATRLSFSGTDLDRLGA
ncbi:MAG TPA: serine hydrolase domain-containing protein [Caulobacteraceae bacterium]|nr:serine hydrolase domain-containing protein [Caulobacteraceae bacterium]